MPRLTRLTAPLEAQRGHLFGWVPVFFAVGIGIFFALRVEPGWPVYAALAACLAGLVLWALRPARPPLAAAGAALIAGFCVAGARSHMVAEPILSFRYYGPIEGRVVAVDRSTSDKVRLTLDDVRLDRISPDRTPARVRISLHGEAPAGRIEPGLRVMTTGHLSPPQGPVEPGGFDFRRMAFFRSLGAVGYTRVPLLVAAPAEEGAAGLWVHRMRMAISAEVQRVLPGEPGAFAAAITTGDRSAMGRETLEALRNSNLAHLLAISGLHMGLLTGFVFAAARFALAAIPWVALRWPAKKIAAVIALGAGAFYYMLSGGIVATERAFIMAAVIFVAVLFDRRAITLRAVAIAAMIVLTLRPETLTEPGFQMSFAATTALVAVFAWLRDWDRWRLPKWVQPVAAVVISSGVAGLATAPVAAAHFNRIADYGLIANLLSVPLMGAIVMPGAVLAALLAPFGLHGVGLAIMKPPIEWILGVAHVVSDLPGAITPVMAPPAAALPLIVLGALWAILWQGRARLAGVAPMLAGFALWSLAERPPVLIAQSGGLIGVMTEAGRDLSKPRGDGFSAATWLENDGDGADQPGAHARDGLREATGLREIALGGHVIAKVSGRGAAERAVALCDTAALVVTTRDVPVEGPCLMLNAPRLRDTGAVAIYPGTPDLRIVTVRDLSGTRLWSP